MLPDDCQECTCCGTPVMAYGSPCDHCIHAAAARLGITPTLNEFGYHDYPDPKTGKDAYWRVAGLLSRWSRSRT